MKNINFPALVVASSFLVGCGHKTPEAQANEMAEQKARIELANNIQKQVTDNTAQILCGKYRNRYSLPAQIIITPGGVYKLSIEEDISVAEKLPNASDIYKTSQDKFLAAKIIRNQECGLKF